MQVVEARANTETVKQRTRRHLINAAPGLCRGAACCARKAHGNIPGSCYAKNIVEVSPLRNASRAGSRNRPPTPCHLRFWHPGRSYGAERSEGSAFSLRPSLVTRPPAPVISNACEKSLFASTVVAGLQSGICSQDGYNSKTPTLSPGRVPPSSFLKILRFPPQIPILELQPSNL